ncbi:MAG: metallophosphoesterase family protein [Myxococcota bacterium]
MPKSRSRKAPRPWSHRSAEVIGRHQDRVRIAVISDTHSRPHPESPRLVAALEPDAIFHAGDVGDLEALRPFEPIAPLTVVRGNIDTRAEALPDSVDIRVTSQQGQGLAIVLLRHICVYGPKLRADAAKAAQNHDANIVVCGHSHVPFIGRDRGMLVFNPGSIGPRRFTLPIVFGVLELSAGRANLYHVSCETGERWTPDAPA